MDCSEMYKQIITLNQAGIRQTADYYKKKRQKPIWEAMQETLNKIVEPDLQADRLRQLAIFSGWTDDGWYFTALLKRELEKEGIKNLETVTDKLYAKFYKSFKNMRKYYALNRKDCVQYPKTKPYFVNLINWYDL